MPQGKDIATGKVIDVYATQTMEVVKVHPYDTEEHVDKGSRPENKI